jgi:hypothetical protein
LAGLDPRQVEDEIMRVYNAVAENKANKAAYETKASQPQEDVFSKAGLPSQLEQYTADTVPRDQRYQATMARAQRMLADVERDGGRFGSYDAEGNWVRTPERKTIDAPGRLGSPSAKASKANPQVVAAQSGAPRSLTEAKQWAKMVGLDEDAAERLYSEARYSVRGSKAQPGTARYDSDGWRVMADSDFAEFEKAWENRVGSVARDRRNPLLNAAAKGERAAAGSLQASQPRPQVAVEDPMWQKAEQLFLAKKRRAEDEAKFGQNQLEGKAKAMQIMGRTPLNDVLAERMAMLRQIGLV